MRTLPLVPILLAALVPAMLLGCPGSLEDPDRFKEGGAGACGDVPTTVFKADCVSAGCHNATDKAGMLDLDSPNVASRVVGVKATNGALLADPANPQSSILYLKVSKSPYGSPMPLGKPALDATTQACVLAWIKSLGAAPADGGTTDAPPPPTDSGVDANDGGRDFTTDRAKFFGASRCSTAGVQLCEDFESGSIDTGTWSINGTTPVVDGVQKARGNFALHITQNGNGLSYIKETKTFPEPNDTYYGRLFVYFHSLPTAATGFAHWTFAAASGTGTQGEIRVSGIGNPGSTFFGVGTDSSGDPMGTGDWTNTDNDPKGAPLQPPLDKWVCIEWLHKGDTSETRFYWDATEHPSLYTTKTMHGGNMNAYVLPTFDNVWVGWQEYQTSSETFEMWFDEIAIDTSRIGCVQ